MRGDATRREGAGRSLADDCRHGQDDRGDQQCHRAVERKRPFRCMSRMAVGPHVVELHQDEGQGAHDHPFIAHGETAVQHSQESLSWPARVRPARTPYHLLSGRTVNKYRPPATGSHPRADDMTMDSGGRPFLEPLTEAIHSEPLPMLPGCWRRCERCRRGSGWAQEGRRPSTVSRCYPRRGDGASRPIAGGAPIVGTAPPTWLTSPSSYVSTPNPQLTSCSRRGRLGSAPTPPGSTRRLLGPGIGRTTRRQ
jgi:hypothetical protein